MLIYGIEFNDQEIAEAQKQHVPGDRCEAISDGEKPTRIEELHGLICDFCLEYMLGGTPPPQ